MGFFGPQGGKEGEGGKRGKLKENLWSLRIFGNKVTKLQLSFPFFSLGLGPWSLSLIVEKILEVGASICCPTKCGNPSFCLTFVYLFFIYFCSMNVWFCYIFRFTLFVCSLLLLLIKIQNSKFFYGIVSRVNT